MSWLAPLASRLSRAAAPVALGVWAVFVCDAITLLARGGSADAVIRLHWMAVALALALALAAALVAELSALPLRLLARRFERTPPPSLAPAVLAGVLLVWGLAPGHATLARHILGAWLTSLYALFPAVGGLIVLDHLRRRAGPRLRLVAAAGLVGVGWLMHRANAELFTGLYPELHDGLALVTAVALVGAFALAFARWSGRRCAVAAAALALTGAVALALPVDPLAARSGMVFHGTESMQVQAALTPWLDGDGDGIPAGLTGADCDDTDPRVHPLMFEVPGNGIDDNCRLGDRPRGVPAPENVEREAEPSPAATAWRAAHPRPDVVMFFVDTLRWDAIDALRDGPALNLTPNIDRLAARGVLFSQARTTAPRTPHAWMSMIRGRFLGRTLSCRARIDRPGTATLPHKMQAAGYATTARLVGKSWPRFHLGDGWDALRMASHVNHVTGPAVARDVIRTLREPGDDPRFIVAHFADPHAPYRPHADFPAAGADLISRYRAEVAATDHHIGEVMKAIEGSGRPTLVILFADHGENLGERGQEGGHHGVSVYDEVVRVPLIIAGPAIAPRRIDEPVSLIDVAPTIIELTGAHRLPHPDGRSLARYVFGEPIAPAPTISEFYDFGLTLRGVVDGRYKLVRDVQRGTGQLFDIVADPGELRDLTGELPEVAERLGRWLDVWVEYRADPSERRPERCGDMKVQPRKTK